MDWEWEYVQVDDKADLPAEEVRDVLKALLDELGFVAERRRGYEYVSYRVRKSA